MIRAMAAKGACARGRWRTRLRPLAAVALAAMGPFATAVARAAGEVSSPPDALWQIVSTCVDRVERPYCECPAFALSCCGAERTPDSDVVWGVTKDFVAIRDLDHDYETGKVAEDDWRTLREELRARAMAYLREERDAAARGSDAVASSSATAAGVPVCPGCSAVPRPAASPGCRSRRSAPRTGRGATRGRARRRRMRWARSSRRRQPPVTRWRGEYGNG